MRISPLASTLLRELLGRFPSLYGYSYIFSFPKIRFLSNPGAALRALNNVQLLSPLVECIAPFSKKIILFGSRGTGLNRDHSDFDVFVVSGNPKKIQELSKKVRIHLPTALDLTVYTPQQEVRIHVEEPLFKKKLDSGIIVWKIPGQDIIAK